jgi:putative ABC transport system permease protein
MLAQLRFYLSHSLNDLFVNKRLTFFALLSVAAGVAAIVSLQTLALMISNTLEVNLQANNRGDFNLTMDIETDEIGDELQSAIDAGIVNENELSFFGQTAIDLKLSDEGVRFIEDWIADNDYVADVTYRLATANEIAVFTGIGAGVSLTDTETGEQVSQLSPIMVDTDVYPFYSTITTTNGDLLGDVMQAPTDVVIGDSLATNLDLQIGDTVRISGSSDIFTVRGIVEAEQEIKSFSSDFFTGIFGFYYLDLSAQMLFDDFAEVTNVQAVYIQLADPTQADAFEAEFRDAFSYIDTESIADLREQNEFLTEQIDGFVAVMGLISLLLGSIGIINTMQVIVRRRMLEVAVLKTLGLQSEQITLLFLMEAFLVGVFGSLAGVLLGWGATIALRGVVSGIFGSDIPFVLAPIPALNGIVVGIIVATVFGFLPTLTAGQVRPNTVLRPSSSVIPRAGILQTLMALALIVISVSIIVQGIIGGNIASAFGYVAGAFILAGIIYLLLNLLIWLIGRFVPSLGMIDLKISLRQMLVSRNRGASTLLALVVGVFSLSTITLFAESISNILENTLEGAGGNVLVTVPSYNQLERVENTIADLNGVNNITENLSYNAQLITYTDSATGTTYTPDDLRQVVGENSADLFAFIPGATDEERNEIAQRSLDSLLLDVGIEARDNFPESDATFLSGRDITSADIDRPVLVLPEDEILNAIDIKAGDTVTFAFVNGGGGLAGIGGNSDEGGIPDDAETVTFEIIGVKASSLEISFGGTGAYAPVNAFPEAVNPTTVSLLVDIDDAEVPAMRRTLGEIPGVFVIETAVLTQLFSSLLGTFTAFPTMVAALGLIVGGVVIANSVALATMERRQQIAVMKAVGLQRERVLGMLLLENGILGFIGGLMGVGFGVIALLLFAATTQAPFSTIPFLLAFGLMMLCVVVALLAAITSAWNASGEKPLTVLRYE